MLLQVTGVLVDGSTRVGTVPVNPRRQINVPRFSALTLRIELVRSDGAPVAIGAGQLILNVKRRSLDSIALIRRAGVVVANSPDNVRNIVLVPNDTRLIVPARYVYDIWYVVSPTDRNVIVPLSPFVVEPGLEPIA